MPEVRGPDGQRYQFPEGTAPDVMKAAMAKRYPKPAVAPSLAEGLGVSMPSQQQFETMRADAVERDAGFEQQLAERGAERRAYLKKDLRYEKYGGDASFPQTDAQLGASGVGKTEGGYFGFDDEVTGLFNPAEGKRRAGLKDYAERAHQPDFESGESQGLMVNALSTLPIAAPKVLQAARLPGVAKAPAAIQGAATGAASGMSWDAAHQMGTATGDLGERIQKFDKGRSALATGVGAVGGTALGGVADVLARSDLKSVATNSASIIDAELTGGLRPQALSAIHRLLQGSGLSSDDIVALNREVTQRSQTATGAAAGRKSIGQLYDEVLNDANGPVYRPQAGLNIVATLRERRMNISRGDDSAGIIGGESKALRDSQKSVLEQSATSNLGDNTRLGVKEQIALTKKDLSSEYDRILEAAPTTGQGADTLRTILKADPSKSSVLRRRAKNAGMSVDEYIDAKPYEAGHWMRSRLAKDARSASGREKGDLSNTVDEIDEVLDGFDAYAATKRDWGTEMGVLDAQTFGDKLFGGANSSLMNNPGLRAELVASFHELSPREQQVALISIKDAALGKMQGGPAGQSARLTSVTSDAAIDFFNEIGAKKFADDLLTIKNEQGFLGSFDPNHGPRTAPNQQAVANAPDLYGSVLSNSVRADGQGMGVIPVELAASQVAPGLSGWYAAYRGLKAGANKAFGLRNATKEDMTRFLMARPGQKTANALAPGPNATAAPAATNALAPQAQSAPAKAPVSNGLPMLSNPTAQGGVIGAGAGAMAPADSNEERLRNMAIGGAMGAGAGRMDRGRSIDAVTNGVRRKDMMRGLREDGSQFQKTAPPSDAPIVREQIRQREAALPQLDGPSALRENMTKVGVAGVGLGVPTLPVLYSMYKAEQHKRNQPAMSMKEFIQVLEAEQMSRQGLPSRPSVKPELPQQ